MFFMNKQAKTWSNWSGSVKALPKQFVAPSSIEDVAAVVQFCRREGRKLRVVGSGHSFTAIAASDDMLMSLDGLQGIVRVDKVARTATVWAGTKLRALGEALFSHGLAQENLGDIDVQSIAGAISTGTHGTGVSFGNISTQVIGLTVVTGRGEVVDCTAESHPEWFKAMQISLGLLGVIVQVTLRLNEAYKLEYESRRLPLADCLPALPRMAEENRHFEFFWFPYAEPCQIKIMNMTDKAPTSRKVKDYFGEVIMENAFFGLLSKTCQWLPRTSRAISRLSASQVPVGQKVEYSHRLFATKRLVRFHEMEYNVPAEAMADVIEEMRGALQKERYHVHFPVECRYAKADDIWLSPAYGRDSAYIAVHMYRGMPYKEYFAAMEAIFLRYEGRPHWGKMHALQGEALTSRYPKWDAFQEVRRMLDPDRIFDNEYMARLFP